MNVWRDASLRRAVSLGAAGLVLLPLACGSRSSLEGRRSSETWPTSGGTFGAAGGRGGSGGGQFGGAGGRPSGTTGGTSAAGTGGSGPEGSGGGGIVTPTLSAPDARRSPPELCTTDGWCGPLGDYVAIWGSSLFDIWVAGTAEIGTPWSDGSPRTISVLLHWNGLVWNTIELPEAEYVAEHVTLTSIWGSSSSDVWVVGSPAFAAHFDGVGWARASLPTSSPIAVTSVWGNGPDDVWLVGGGSSGSLFHFDGSGWTTPAGPSLAGLSSVWSTASDLWVVSVGTPLHSQNNAQTWSPNPPEWIPSSPIPSPWWNVVWGHQDGGLFAAGHDGALGTWTDAGWAVHAVGAPDSAPDFQGLWGLSGADVWAVGDAGMVAHWDGTSWAEAPRPTGASLRDVWGANSHYYAVGNQGTFLELEADEWMSNQPSPHKLNAIWGGALDDVWAVGQDTVHWDGSGWFPVPDPADFELNGVWGSSRNDVWAIGNAGTRIHWDGMSWTLAPALSPEDITGVWGSSWNDVWTVDAGGYFYHFSGETWDKWPSESWGPLTAVYGTSASNVIAVGDNGVRVHFDGHTWSRLPSDPAESPDYLTAFGDGTDVYIGGMNRWSAFMAGGAFPRLGRWNGSTLVDDLEPTESRLTLSQSAVGAGWAGGPNDIWIALSAPMHWDGSNWTDSALDADIGVATLGGTSEDIWAATFDGMMLRKKRN